MKIYCQVGNIAPYIVDKARNIEDCKRRIAWFERQDRYEIETEKYPMPKHWNGEYPKYTIGR